MENSANTNFDWFCVRTWTTSAKNTGWCLLGCAIGDFGTILFFQLTKIPFPVLAIMILAIINGLITSIILETIILIRQGFSFYETYYGKTVSVGTLIEISHRNSHKKFCWQIIFLTTLYIVRHCYFYCIFLVHLMGLNYNFMI